MKHPGWQKKVAYLYGPHTVDLMASDSNAMLDRSTSFRHFTHYQGVREFLHRTLMPKKTLIFSIFCSIPPTPILKFLREQRVWVQLSLHQNFSLPQSGSSHLIGMRNDLCGLCKYVAFFSSKKGYSPKLRGVKAAWSDFWLFWFWLLQYQIFHTNQLSLKLWHFSYLHQQNRSPLKEKIIKMHHGNVQNRELFGFVPRMIVFFSTCIDLNKTNFRNISEKMYTGFFFLIGLNIMTFIDGNVKVVTNILVSTSGANFNMSTTYKTKCVPSTPFSSECTTQHTPHNFDSQSEFDSDVRY